MNAGAGKESGVLDLIGKLDGNQAAMMEEPCILVDREDRPLRPLDKARTHLTSQGLALHRAFSVFIFDTQGRMLLQQRSRVKHTFTLNWTNACCSHPLWNDFEMGIDSGEVGDPILGARRAAVRKLGQELGIPEGELPLENFCFLTKIHYRAESESGWGEHEIDYVFVLRGEYTLRPNENEVEAVRWVTPSELRGMMKQEDEGLISFTPWSRHIMEEFAFDWWGSVGDRAKLLLHADEQIHRVGACKDPSVC
jgi:isopentenyl-diphosphate delta-isomerase